MYMKNAMEQYHEKRTTIAQRKRNQSELEPPVLVVCPYPPLKLSFLEGCNINHKNKSFEKGLGVWHR